jgi:hypothetical protein
MAKILEKEFEMKDDLLETVKQIKNKEGELLLYIYEGLPELWHAYARASYDRLIKLRVRNLGKQGAAELAIKIAEFLSSKVGVNENI